MDFASLLPAATEARRPPKNSDGSNLSARSYKRTIPTTMGKGLATDQAFA